MFHKFAERYLCAVHRMKNLKISIGINAHRVEGNSYGRDAKYARANCNTLDPLAFMLEGCKASGNCYLDFAQERAIPLLAMTTFQIYLNGQEDNNSWVRENPSLKKELQNLAYGVFYYMRENYNDSRFYLDSVEELGGKTKLKQLITNPRAGLPKRSNLDFETEIRARIVQIRETAQYNNRLW